MATVLAGWLGLLFVWAVGRGEKNREVLVWPGSARQPGAAGREWLRLGRRQGETV